MAHTIGEPPRRRTLQTGRKDPLTEILHHPLPGRPEKPRRTGVTMVIDQGLGLSTLIDCLRLGAEYIDFVKLAFGTAALYPPDLLREKVAFIGDYEVTACPGGTAFEVAHHNDQGRAYLDAIRDLGLTAVEISDGTIELPPGLRREYIAAAKACGLTVLSEVGKKDAGQRLSRNERCRRVRADVEAGADYVILEGRTSGRGIGIYDANGQLRSGDADAVLRAVDDPDMLLWEAPTKTHQAELLRRFGPSVNLGNVRPEDTLALEALRVGLRGDTFRDAVEPLT